MSLIVKIGALTRDGGINTDSHEGDHKRKQTTILGSRKNLGT